MHLKSIFIVSSVVWLGFVGRAEATHKAWLVKNSGGQCALQVTTTTDSYPGVFKNPNPWGEYVTCPVVSASRGGSASGPEEYVKTWASAKQARIFFHQPNSYFWCQARVEDITGNVFYGDSNRTSPGTGYQFIDLIMNENDWGGDLEASEQNYIEQVDIECRVGSQSGGTPARLLGYEVAFCQNLTNCNTVRTDNRGGSSTVQGSGIECAPSDATSAGSLQRSEAGMKNVGSSTVSTHCPITTPTDDSYEHNREVSNLQVFFTGSVPTCRVESINKDGVEANSANLVYDSFWGRLELSTPLATGLEKTLSLKCDVPPNTSIEGYTTRTSLTRKSGGI